MVVILKKSKHQLLLDLKQQKIIPEGFSAAKMHENLALMKRSDEGCDLLSQVL